MQKLYCLLSVLLSGISNTVAAQLPDFSFRHYTIENGFPASSILQVTQDKPGFIWSLNDYGLIRFDGNNFRTYRPDNADSFSLPQAKFIISERVERSAPGEL
jgi:ligand-binding sensor domain-containing protein